MPHSFLTATPSHAGYYDVTPEELAARACEARIVDVREPDEFHGELGHLPGSESIPLGDVPERAGAWAPGDPVVLVCRSGRRSARAAEMLVRAGFERVGNLVGGMLAWNARDLPVVLRSSDRLVVVRDELLDCYARVHAGEDGAEASFRAVFDRVGASFDAPSEEELRRVVAELRRATIEGGADRDSVDRHVDKFRRVLDGISRS